MMRSYYDSLQLAFSVLAQVLLNRFGIIPEDSGLFSGLGQFFYVLLVIAHATIVGVVNLILFVIAKRKAR